MPHTEALSKENEERGLNPELPPRSNPDLPRTGEVVVVVQNPAPPNSIEEQTKKHQRKENEHKENAEIPQSRVNDPNQAHNDDHHQPAPQHPNQIHSQVEPTIQDPSSAPSNPHIHPHSPSPIQVPVPLPLIRVIPPPNPQNQNIGRAPLPSTGPGQ